MTSAYLRLLPIAFLFVSVLMVIGGLQPGLLESRLVVVLFFAAVGLGVLAIPLEAAFFLLFLYVGVEGAAKLLSRYNPVIHVGLDILVCALTLKALLSVVYERNQLTHRFPFIVKLIGVHFLWFFVVFFNPYALSMEASLAAAKLYVVPVMFFFFGALLCENEERLEFFTLPWMIVTWLHILTGLYQGAIGPSSVTSWGPMYGRILERFRGYAFRPFGLTSNPGGPAPYTYMTLPFALYYYVSSRNLLWKVLSVLMVALLVVLLFLCQVKSAIIKCIGAVLFFFFLLLLRIRDLGFGMRRDVTIFFALLLGILLFAFPLALKILTDTNPENQQAIAASMRAFDPHIMGHARQGATDRFLTYAEMAPFGTGLSRIGPAVYRYQNLIDQDPYFKGVIFFSDNLFVQLVVDIGVPGVFVFTLLMLTALWEAGRAVRWAPTIRSYALASAIFCSLCAIVFGSYGAEPLLYQPEGGFFWFFSGGLYRLGHPDIFRRERRL